MMTEINPFERENDSHIHFPSFSCDSIFRGTSPAFLNPILGDDLLKPSTDSSSYCRADQSPSLNDLKACHSTPKKLHPSNEENDIDKDDDVENVPNHDDDDSLLEVLDDQSFNWTLDLGYDNNFILAAKDGDNDNGLQKSLINSLGILNLNSSLQVVVQEDKIASVGTKDYESAYGSGSQSVAGTGTQPSPAFQNKIFTPSQKQTPMLNPIVAGKDVPSVSTESSDLGSQSYSPSFNNHSISSQNNNCKSFIEHEHSVGAYYAGPPFHSRIQEDIMSCSSEENVDKLICKLSPRSQLILESRVSPKATNNIFHPIRRNSNLATTGSGLPEMRAEVREILNRDNYSLAPKRYALVPAPSKRNASDSALATSLYTDASATKERRSSNQGESNEPSGKAKVIPRRAISSAALLHLRKKNLQEMYLVKNRDSYGCEFLKNRFPSYTKCFPSNNLFPKSGELHQ